MAEKYELEAKYLGIKHDEATDMITFKTKYKLLETEFYMLNSTKEDFAYTKEMLEKAVGNVKFKGFVDINKHLMVEELSFKTK